MSKGTGGQGAAGANFQGGGGGGTAAALLKVPPNPQMSLPSANIVHSAVLVSEMENRRHQFETMIIAMEGERDGQQEAWEAARNELDGKHEQSMRDLDRRLADLRRGHAILQAGLALAVETADPKRPPAQQQAEVQTDGDEETRT